MSKTQEFLQKSKDMLGEKSIDSTSDFLEVLKAENLRQIKRQLGIDLAPIKSELKIIKDQQSELIQLLKHKISLDAYEKEIMDLLKKKLEQG